MANSVMIPEVDAYLARAERWRDEFKALRAIALGCELTEQFKWGHPCYVSQKRNIVLIHGFKEYCALLFFKGTLLKDPHGILIRQTENVQAARQVRFSDPQEVVELVDVLKDYIHEAIAVEQAGLAVNRKTISEFAVPQEFQGKLDEIPALKAAFDALSPSRQHSYILYFSAPKQSKTREARVQKCLQQILDGKGLND
jgi:uncharacterized protein YdeI (YjbR/CyaY-like superfamily)